MTTGRVDGVGRVATPSETEDDPLVKAVESLTVAPAGVAMDDLQTALAVLTMELAREQRRAGDEQRDAAMKAQEDAHTRKIAKMHELADDTFAQGLVEGAAQATSALFTFDSARHGFKAAAADARGDKVAAAAHTQLSKIDDANGKLASAAGTIGGAALKAAQERDRADIAVIDREMDRAKADVDGASAQSKQAQDDIRDGAFPGATTKEI